MQNVAFSVSLTLPYLQHALCCNHIACKSIHTGNLWQLMQLLNTLLCRHALHSQPLACTWPCGQLAAQAQQERTDDDLLGGACQSGLSPLQMRRGALKALLHKLCARCLTLAPLPGVFRHRSSARLGCLVQIALRRCGSQRYTHSQHFVTCRRSTSRAAVHDHMCHLPQVNIPSGGA